MSETGEWNNEYRRTAESYQFLTPNYPYNDIVLQLTVLQNMGYPVELQPVKSADFPEDLFSGDLLHRYKVAKFPDWVRPVITNPAFEERVESPDTPGDYIDAGEFDDLISGHPMQISADVARGHADTILFFIVEFEDKGSLPHIHPHDEGLLTRELLERCLVAAYEQNAKMREGITPELTKYYPQPVLATEIFYKQLKDNGIDAITPEELMALYYDYYHLVERLIPDFAAFKVVAEEE